MSLDVVNVLSDLVRIPSVNPMGRPVSGDIYYEHRVTQHLEQLFRGLGLPVERHTVAPLPMVEAGLLVPLPAALHRAAKPRRTMPA